MKISDKKKVLHRIRRRITGRGRKPMPPSFTAPPAPLPQGPHQLFMELPASSLPTEITSRYKDVAAVNDGTTLPSINNKGMDTPTTVGLLRKQFQVAPS